MSSCEYDEVPYSYDGSANEGGFIHPFDQKTDFSGVTFGEGAVSKLSKTNK